MEPLIQYTKTEDGVDIADCVQGEGPQRLHMPIFFADMAGETPPERSDLSAWGLVLLECLTGRHPFEAEGAAARLMTGGGAVEIPEWLQGHRLGELLEAVTAREPVKRDVSVETLIEALDGGGPRGARSGSS